MYIKNRQIHKEMRMRGMLLRAILPYFKHSTYDKYNKLLQLKVGKHDKSLRYEQRWIPRTDGDEKKNMRICIYRPKEQKGLVPGFLFLHGGGYAMGTPEQEEKMYMDIIRATGCVIISPEYRLSGEAPYPAALEDAYSALCWMKKHAEELGINPEQLMVGGDSAGGGLTAALCIYARDKKEVSIAFQLPIYPMLDDRMITPSSQCNDAPMWNTKSNEIAWKQYLGELYGTDEVPVYAAPSRLNDYTGLPPAFTFVGDIEPFYDETIIYMENLKKAGIRTHYKVFKGCFHGFDAVASKTEPAIEARRLMIQELQYALEHDFVKQPEER